MLYSDILNVTSPEGQRKTTNEGIWREFRYFFRKLFTMEPILCSAQFNVYLAVFPRLEAMEVDEYEKPITKDEIRQALKTVETDKTPGIDGTVLTKCTWGCPT